jgi:hypothetical protein
MCPYTAIDLGGCAEVDRSMPEHALLGVKSLAMPPGGGEVQAELGEIGGGGAEGVSARFNRAFIEP